MREESWRTASDTGWEICGQLLRGREWRVLTFVGSALWLVS